MIIQHRIYELQPGDIVLLNGLTMHRANSIPSYPNIRTTIEFQPEFITPILTAMNATKLLDMLKLLNNSIIRLDDLSKLANFENCIFKLNQLLSTFTTKAQRKDSLIESHAINILIEIIFEIFHLSQSKISKLVTNKSKNDLLIENMLAWIMEHHTEKLTLHAPVI